MIEQGIIMSRLLRYIPGIGRLKKDVAYLKTSKLYQCEAWSSTSRSRNQLSCTKEWSGISSVTLPKSESVGSGRKHITNLTRHTGKVSCATGFISGLLPCASAGLQIVSTACLHTSSHLHGRIPSFFQRHRQGFREAPSPALALGFSGLIPFVAPAVYIVATFSISLNILLAQVAYGATILSFLGGVRWGFALTEGRGIGPTWSTLGYSVLPPLIAWLGLLMPLQSSQLCIMTGVFIAWIADANTKAYPTWFRSLRLLLSLVALTSLGVSFGYSLVLEPISEEHGSNLIKLIKIVKIILEE